MKLLNGKHLSFPFRMAANGRMAAVKSLEEHVRDEIIQLILTNPGERPFLVDFGGGVRRLVFEAADDTTAAMAKALLTQAINRWLGHRVILEYVDVEEKDSTLAVDIKYRLMGTEEPRSLKFLRSGKT